MKSMILLAVVFACACAGAGAPKNILLFIGDGMSTPQRMTADEFARSQGRAPLVINRLKFQATTRTCSASSLVTDSAAAATAIACGTKTYNHGMGVDAVGKPLVSCAEVAKKAGKRVGIVTSVTIDHATPAAFYAHRKDRGENYAIGLDLIASGFDLFAGGGHSRPDDRKSPLYRGNVYELAAQAGYRVILQDRAAFERLRPGVGKVWYAATQKEMPYAIDAGRRKDVPTLAEMTRKAIELMDGSEKGFFLMVEGGSIDWAGHANDAATNLREVLALADAVEEAVAYQKHHPDTLVIVTGDHETGGMTMGFQATGYALFVDRLAYQKCSASALVRHLAENTPATFDEIIPFLSENFGLDFSTGDGEAPSLQGGAADGKTSPMGVTAAERKMLADAFAHDRRRLEKGLKDDPRYDAQKLTRFPTAVKNVFSHKCGIGWTSGNHTALPVLTTAQGPGAERFCGFIDNTDIAKIIKEFVR